MEGSNPDPYAEGALTINPTGDSSSSLRDEEEKEGGGGGDASKP